MALVCGFEGVFLSVKRSWHDFVFADKLSRGFNSRTECCSPSLGFSMSLVCLMLLTKMFLALPVMESLESCELQVTGYDEVSPR